MAASAGHRGQRPAGRVTLSRLRAPTAGRGLEAFLTKLRPSKKTATLCAPKRAAVSKRPTGRGPALASAVPRPLPTERVVLDCPNRERMAAGVKDGEVRSL